jgi:hypothetical protein
MKIISCHRSASIEVCEFDLRIVGSRGGVLRAPRARVSGFTASAATKRGKPGSKVLRDVGGGGRQNRYRRGRRHQSFVVYHQSASRGCPRYNLREVDSSSGVRSAGSSFRRTIQGRMGLCACAGLYKVGVSRYMSYPHSARVDPSRPPPDRADQARCRAKGVISSAATSRDI